MGSIRAAAAQCHPAEQQQELKSETKTKTLIIERLFVNLHWCFKGLQKEGMPSQSTFMQKLFLFSFPGNLEAKLFCHVSEVNYAAEWVQNSDIT